MEQSIHKFGLRNPASIHSFEDYRAMVELASDMFNGSRWAIGDLYLLGDARWRETFQQAFDFKKKSYDTIRNCASLARCFPEERRIFDVSPSHYETVRALPEFIQNELLRQAELKDWSRHELRKAVRRLRLDLKPERETIITSAKLATQLLLEDIGLDPDCEVRISFEIVSVVQDEKQENVA